MEFFGYGQVGQCDVQMVVWWFVYLVVYQGYFVQYVGVFYFVVEVVIFMSMFVYICEYGIIVVFDGDVMDQFYYIDGFVYVGVVEQVYFVVFGEWVDQVDYFDVGFQQFVVVSLVGIGWSFVVDVLVFFFVDGIGFVDWVVQYVYDLVQGCFIDWYGDGSISVVYVQVMFEVFGGIYCNGMNYVVVQLLLDFQGGFNVLNFQGFIDVWYGIVWEFYVDYGVDDLNDMFVIYVWFF